MKDKRKLREITHCSTQEYPSCKYTDKKDKNT